MMNKPELIEAIANHAGLTTIQVSKALEGLEEAVGTALTRDEAVVLPGLGKLTMKYREARKGRNPQSGEEIQIAAKNVVSFKAAKALNDQINA